MRYLCFYLAILLAPGLLLTGQEKKAPAKLTLAARNGNVTYDHAAHAEREKNDCKVCHDALWPQDASAPLGYRAGAHRPAERDHKSCGACHYAGGKSFEAKGNCTKCHVKGGA